MVTKFGNFAETTLSQSLLAAATEAYLTSATNWPTLSPGDTCKATIYDGVNAPEIVELTARSGTTITITRGDEGTAATAWAAGSKIVIAPTAEQLQTIYNQTVSVGYFGSAAETSVNNFTVTLGTVPALGAGIDLSFIVPAGNTGAVQIRLSDGATPGSYFPLVRPDGAALESGDLISGWMIICRYEAADDEWRIISPYTRQIEATNINDAPFATNFASNGGFSFWEGGTSIATPASGAEVADDFFVRYDGTIGAFTVSRQAFTPGQTDVPGEPTYFLRWDHSSAGSGSTFRDLEWRDVVNARWGAGDDTAVGFWIRGDSSFTVTAQIIQDFGTGGSPSSAVTVTSQAISVTTSWQFVSLLQTMTSLSGKTIGSNNDDTIKIRFKLPLNAAFRVDIAQFQPELGDRTTKFSPKPQSSIPLPVPITFGGTGVTTKAAFKTSYDLEIGIDLQAWDADLDVFAATPLTSAELTQLQNINANTLGTTQWAALASATGNFGTAAFVNLGTSGATVPQNNGNNTFSGVNLFTGKATFDGRARFNQNIPIEIYSTSSDRYEFAVDGSTLYLNRLNNAGTYQDTPFQVTNGTGVILSKGYIIYHAGNIASQNLTLNSLTLPATEAIVNVSGGGYMQWQNASPSIRGYIGTIGLDASAATTDFVIRAESKLHFSLAGAKGATLDLGGFKNASDIPYNQAGKQAIPIPAAALTPSTTSGAAPAVVESTTNKIMLIMLDFDASIQEFAHCSMAMPKGWNEGTITARFGYTATATGNVMWGFQARAISDDDVLDAAWGTQQDILDSVTAANDFMWSPETPALTIGGSPAEGDIVFFRFYRNGGNGSDTCAVDARLLAVQLFLTTNAANDT